MEYWLQQAKMLPAGKHRKIQCCSRDESMRIENGTQGYRGYCFRCKETKFEAHGMFSVQELHQRRQELELWERDVEVSIPRDRLELAAAGPLAQTWLLRAGIGQDLWKSYSLGYSPRLQRVILPVYMSSTLQAVVLRNLTTIGPKYLIRERNNDTVFYSSIDTIYPSDRHKDYGYDLVITEDILSAIRVGRIVSAASIVGTAISAGKIANIIKAVHTIRAKMAKPERKESNICVGIWLDPDAAGYNASRRLEQALRLQGYDVVRISSTKDPKRHSNREIRSYLTDGKLHGRGTIEGVHGT